MTGICDDRGMGMIRIPLKKGCKLIFRIKGNKELETRVLRRGRKCLSFLCAMWK